MQILPRNIGIVGVKPKLLGCLPFMQTREAETSQTKNSLFITSFRHKPHSLAAFVISFSVYFKNRLKRPQSSIDPSFPQIYFSLL